MESKKQTGGNGVEKVNALNPIFEDAISDASELINDLNWSVKTYRARFRAYHDSVWHIRDCI